MADFDRALQHVLRWEGGYVDDPDDPGGRTDRGISERAHPEAWADDKITEEEAHRIYREEYWGRFGLDEIESDELALMLFDSFVNLGPMRPTMWCQSALQNMGQDVTLDGMMGPQTRAACNRVDGLCLCNRIGRKRSYYYRRLAAASPRMGRFLRGWLNRIPWAEEPPCSRP